MHDHPDAVAHVDDELVAEVADDRDERAEVQGDVERLLDRRVVEVVPVEQPRHEQEMTARRDRQELGEPLHEAEDDGMEDGHGALFYSTVVLGRTRDDHGRGSSQ